MKSASKHNLFLRPVELLGAQVISVLEGLGRFIRFNGQTFYWMLKRPFRFRLVVEQMLFVGNKSVWITVLTSLFTGMVFAYQTYLGFTIINADGFIGPIVSVSLAKELAPVLTGLIIAGRCGAAMAAQIGSMKVTEQIDALEVMGINSYQFLAVPRVIAGFFCLPMLMIIFQLIGNFGSWVIGTKVLGIDEVTYFSALGDFVHLSDIFEGIIKAFFFGYLVAMIGCYHGFMVQGGAEGVGRGTNLSVVWGMVMVLILDFFLTSFLTQIL